MQRAFVRGCDYYRFVTRLSDLLEAMGPSVAASLLGFCAVSG